MEKSDKPKPEGQEEKKGGEITEDPMLSIKEDFDKKQLGKIAENGELDLYKVSIILTKN